MFQRIQEPLSYSSNQMRWHSSATNPYLWHHQEHWSWSLHSPASSAPSPSCLCHSQLDLSHLQMPACDLDPALLHWRELHKPGKQREKKTVNNLLHFSLGCHHNLHTCVSPPNITVHYAWHCKACEITCLLLPQTIWAQIAHKCTSLLLWYDFAGCTS